MFDWKLLLTPIARKYIFYRHNKITYAEYFIFGIRVAKMGIHL